MTISNKVAEVKINYKPKKFTSKLKITNSEDAHKFLRSIWSDQIGYKEQFYVLLLNTGNYILGYNLLGTGGTAGVVADVKIILQLAIKTNAQNIIISHNHPSGNKIASKQDLELTNKLKNALKLLDMNLFDHLILMPHEEEYLSMADEGLL